MEEYERVVSEQLERMRAFRASGRRLRVREDGRPIRDFGGTPKADLSLSINPYARYVEIWGSDDEGDDK